MKKKILIIGSNGMLGHSLVEELSKFHFVVGVQRKSGSINKKIPTFFISDAYDDVDKIKQFILREKPNVIINCLGVVKQSSQIKDKKKTTFINSKLPHLLYESSKKIGSFFIQISTDCVFSGKRGNYTEEDSPDPVDFYGESKLSGEVVGPGALTLRTSIIGLEKNTKRGLFEWLITQEGNQIDGYENAIFSGVTTYSLAQIMLKIIDLKNPIEGIFHISSASISKLKLLQKLNKALDLGCKINPASEPKIDRSLDSSKFWHTIQSSPPSWDEMIIQIKTKYKESYK